MGSSPSHEMNMVKEVLLLTAVALYQTSNAQNFKEYCNQKGCTSNTHLLCTHGDIQRGTDCNGVVLNQAWTLNAQDNMLRAWNGQRSQVALGLQEDFEGNLFPRAYAMSRLFWNKEFELMAKTFANQCFPDVKSFKGCLSTNDYPEAYLLYEEYNEKLKTGVSWDIGGFKHCIIPKKRLEIYTHYEKEISDYKERSLLNTHICYAMFLHTTNSIGCHSVYHEALKKTFVYCVFSTSLTEGKPVLLFSKPKDGSPNCGCYPGWQETSGCLCVLSKELGATKSTKPYFGVVHNYEPIIAPRVHSNKTMSHTNKERSLPPLKTTTTSVALATTPAVSTFFRAQGTSSSQRSTTKTYFILALEVTPETTPLDLDVKSRKEFVERFFNLSLDSDETATVYGEDEDRYLLTKNKDLNNTIWNIIRRNSDTHTLQQKHAVSYNLTLLFDALTKEVLRNKPVGKAREYFDKKMKRIYNLIHKEDGWTTSNTDHNFKSQIKSKIIINEDIDSTGIDTGSQA